MLERDWPDHDFSLIEDVWWPAEEEPEDAIVDRAARFRADLARRHDWANTLVISHWGFILTLTGQSVANGQWLRCDPTEPAPASGVAGLEDDRVERNSSMITPPEPSRPSRSGNAVIQGSSSDITESWWQSANNRATRRA